VIINKEAVAVAADSAVSLMGGQVDVAIISKADRFVWIKRKQYFKPELNQERFIPFMVPGASNGKRG
jgi:hypothetical protein